MVTKEIGLPKQILTRKTDETEIVEGATPVDMPSVADIVRNSDGMGIVVATVCMENSLMVYPWYLSVTEKNLGKYFDAVRKEKITGTKDFMDLFYNVEKTGSMLLNPRLDPCVITSKFDFKIPEKHMRAIAPNGACERGNLVVVHREAQSTTFHDIFKIDGAFLAKRDSATTVMLTMTNANLTHGLGYFLQTGASSYACYDIENLIPSQPAQETAGRAHTTNQFRLELLPKPSGID